MKLEKDDTIEIHKTGDGFILKQNIWEETNKEGVKLYSEDVEVIEGCEEKGFATLVEKLSQACGFPYNKHGKENIRVSWDKKGHKLE